jgi:dolichyl-phosphate beta-glucosyltransferase
MRSPQPFRPDVITPSSAGRDTLPATIVVPCYNESSRLDINHFSDFLSRNAHLRVLFVNDGSKDTTQSLLETMVQRHPSQARLIALPVNSGKAEAVRQGLLAAFADGAELAGYWDADLATPLDAIADFVAVAQRFPQVEVIFGSRRQMLGHRIERSLHRRLVSRICAQMARFAVGLPVADTQCGAKFLRRGPAVDAAIAAPFSAGWLFDVELFTRIAAGLAAPQRSFYELPLAEWTEIPGSKVTGRAIMRSGVQMLRLVARRHVGAPLTPRTGTR